jgi:hypothetical protein
VEAVAAHCGCVPVKICALAIAVNVGALSVAGALGYGGGAAAAASVEKTDNLLNTDALVAALKAAPHGRARQKLLTTTIGWHLSRVAGVDGLASLRCARRRFERLCDVLGDVLTLRDLCKALMLDIRATVEALTVFPTAFDEEAAADVLTGVVGEGDGDGASSAVDAAACKQSLDVAVLAGLLSHDPRSDTYKVGPSRYCVPRYPRKEDPRTKT